MASNANGANLGACVSTLTQAALRELMRQHAFPFARRRLCSELLDVTAAAVLLGDVDVVSSASVHR
jgi:hypothetical protein